MSEREYMLVSALQRLRAALSLVNAALPVRGIANMDAERTKATRAIATIVAQLEVEVTKLMECEGD